MPAVLHQLHAGATEIKVGLTTPTRDFTYATDTAAGFLAIAESDATVGRSLNLGSGTEVSIGELIGLLIEVSGSSADIVQDAARIRPAGGEVHRLLADNSAIRALTSWRPRVTLRAGLQRASDWIRENLHTSPVRYQV